MYKFVQNTSGGLATQVGTVRTAAGGGDEYALIEIGFDSKGVGYANVPSTPDDANNNRAATSKFVNDRISAHDATLVHTTGSETISGSKTFESPVVSKAVSLIQSTNWSGIRLNDTSRTSDSNKMLAQILDADGKRWIGLETTASTDGSRTVQLIGRNRDDTAWLNFIKFWERADGTYNVYLARNPVTESNDSSIATTAWVTQKVNSNKLTIGNPVSQGASTSGSCTKNTIVYINSSGSLSDVKINGTTVATTSGYHAEQAQQVTLFVPAGGTWSVGHTGNGSVTSVLYQEIN